VYGYGSWRNKLVEYTFDLF